MSGLISVNPEHLVISAKTVDTHGQHVSATHTAADAQIDSALGEWAGASQAAMAAKAADWQALTASFAGRLADQAMLLHTTGIEFHDTDDDSAQKIGAVGANAARGACRFV